MIDLYLASTSPRRQELLTQIGLQYQTLFIDVPEVREALETPEAYVQRLSKNKALAGAIQVCDAPVLGADTIGVLDGQVLEKPQDEADAIQMLCALSGRTHFIHTAISLASPGINRPVNEIPVQTQLVTSEVTFRTLKLQEIKDYWASGEPQDKAGAYGIQGLAGRFVSRIAGSYSAIVGLPLMETEQYVLQWWHSHQSKERA